MTGLQAVAKVRAGQFSLGMSQRLSIAAALLGNPHNLVLDEPINGLDPEGIKWVRDLCRYYAAEGRAVLLSSHLMSEVALTATPTSTRNQVTKMINDVPRIDQYCQR